jgi:membrane protease YdiL (CAAX protease family)
MTNSASWQMRLPCALAIWVTVVLIAAFGGLHAGLSGARFSLALGVAAALFGFELFLASPSIRAGVEKILGGSGRLLAALFPLFAVLIYCSGVTGTLTMTLLGAAYVLVPALLLSASAGSAGGTWADCAAVLVIWLPVEFRWMYRLFPYPPQLTHTLTVLTAMSTAVVAFLLVRKFDGVGYAVEWRSGFLTNFVLHFAILAAIAIPIGLRIHFLVWAPALRRGHFLPLDALGILFFTAWPEEFLFRGLLQNLLSKTLKNQWAGLAVASVIFGLSHIFHAPYPNWRYVFLATIAGLFYGHAWMKSGSLVPGALVHALVDFSWHILFR